MRRDEMRRSSSSAIASCRESSSEVSRTGLDYYSEFIDQARFPHADYQAGFRDFLRLKYEDQRFDLVIAMGDIPLEFVDRIGRCSSAIRRSCSSPIAARVAALANSTGVIAELNLSGTLALATELQPDLEHVFVVSGAGEPDGRSNARRERSCSRSSRGSRHVSVRPADQRPREAAARRCPRIPSSTTWSSTGTAPTRTSIRWNTWIGSRQSRTRRSIAGSTPRWITASSAAA